MTNAHRVQALSREIITLMQERHEKALAAAADRYQRRTKAAKEASDELAEAMRAAYKDGERQSAILRAAKHVWSREYVRVVLGLTKRSAK